MERSLSDCLLATITYQRDVDRVRREGTMVKHMKGEWETSVNSKGEFDICEAGGGDMIADLDGLNNAEANAAFIVQACNSHDELVEACKMALRGYKVIRDTVIPLLGNKYEKVGTENDEIEILEQALAKATKNDG